MADAAVLAPSDTEGGLEGKHPTSNLQPPTSNLQRHGTLHLRRWMLDVGRWMFGLYPSSWRVMGAWWPSRSSKPLSARSTGRGMFDSYPLRHFHLRLKRFEIPCFRPNALDRPIGKRRRHGHSRKTPVGR